MAVPNETLSSGLWTESAVVTHKPGSVGRSVADGRTEMEVMGGIWSDVDTESKFTEAMRDVEMARYTEDIARAKDDRESKLEYKFARVIPVKCH